MRHVVSVGVVLSAAGLLAVVAPAAAEIIVLKSGQSGAVPGSVGQLDDIVTYLPNNPPGAAIQPVLPFSPAEYAGAVAGPQATVIQAHPAWTPGISDPDARWINFGIDRVINSDGTVGGTGYGLPGSSLYAVPFFVNTPGATGGFLNMEFAVDDTGGDWYFPFLGGNPDFLYVNGAPAGYSGGNYASSTFHNQFISFSSGQNYLYLYQRDAGVLVSGLIFSITIDVVPAPGVAGLAGVGLLAAARRRR